MSKIYTINNNKTNEGKIPSMEYIETLIKMIEDALIIIVKNNKTFDGFKGIATEPEELLVGKSMQESINAKDVCTDSNHRFINEAVLNALIDKPSFLQIEQSLDDVKRELENKINESYMRIINTPNAINKLRDIATILHEDELINGIIETIASKATIDQLTEHANSRFHLDNNDRKALNLLIRLLSNGFADWNAESGDFNSIKNKPESLPANGGNADTIAEHNIYDVINKNIEDLVFGVINEQYDKDSCDMIANCDAYCKNIIDKINSDLKSGGSVLFKKGTYQFNTFKIRINNPLNITGVNGLTLFTGKEFRIADAVFIKDITFVKSNIIIESNCTFDNVIFDNCTITFNKSENCNIKNCIFKNCKFTTSGSLLNNMIVYNRFINSDKFAYIGGDNLITNNIGNN